MKQLTEMSGLDHLKAMQAGDMPPAPIALLLGFEPIEVEEGRVRFAAVPKHEHYNPIGSVHAGLAATLIDSACGAAVHSTLGTGEAYTTLETSCNFARAINAETGEIRSNGRVIHRGGRVATAEAQVTRARDGKLVAHGKSTCLIIRAGS